MWHAGAPGDRSSACPPLADPIKYTHHERNRRDFFEITMDERTNER
jgi:hypothetical protein